MLLEKILKKHFNIDSIDFCSKAKVRMDSRLVEEGDIFFAINSGNNFVDDVLKKNPSLIVADNKFETSDKRIVFVKNTILTMQELANLYKKSLDLKVVAITGSNGKTTTKDILYYILSEKFKTKKTEGNYNNHIGMPFTILTTDEDTEILLLELGMSNLGEIDLLAKICEPDFGIITNIGFSHLEYLKTKENVFKAKTEMLKYLSCENIFVPKNDEYLSEVSGNKISIEDFFEDDKKSSFVFENEKYESNLSGEYNSLNIAFGISVAKKLGMKKNEIQNGIDKCKITPMRFEKIMWKKCFCVNDAYNSSPISVEAGLKSFYNIYKRKYKIAVLGDMLELGENEVEFHVQVLKSALDLGYDKIFLFGNIMRQANDKVKNSKIFYFDNKKNIRDKLEIIANEKKGELAIFLKASRGMRFEEILIENIN
ncbi:MAG: UDP-N-acetylmuramoyl-tripeptide--D-alanyl-D-alanine ligase [Fusobacteriaceae bacterium]